MKDEVKEYIDTLDLGRSQAIQFMSCACGNLLHSTAVGKRGEGRVEPTSMHEDLLTRGLVNRNRDGGKISLADAAPKLRSDLEFILHTIAVNHQVYVILLPPLRRVTRAVHLRSTFCSIAGSRICCPPSLSHLECYRKCLVTL